MTPEEAPAIRDEIKARRIVAGVHQLVTNPLILQAAERFLGDPDTLVTPEEARTYQALKLVLL